MKTPWVDFPLYMASQIGMIGSPAWYDKVFANPAAPDAVAGASPVGTGPFVFESWKPGDTLVVKKNPNYWRQDADGNAMPYLDGIEFRVIADELTRANALESGELDLMPTDNGENIMKFRDNGDFTYLEQSERGETIHVLLHSARRARPLQDQRVRCGLAAAIQQDVIAEVIGQGALPHRQRAVLARPAGLPRGQRLPEARPGQGQGADRGLHRRARQADGPVLDGHRLHRPPRRRSSSSSGGRTPASPSR